VSLADAAPAPPELVAPGYMRSLLCFRDFLDDQQILAALGDATAVEVPRGALVLAADDHHTDLLLVVRGAVEATVRRGAHAQSVRLTGPGRFVAHVGAIDGAASPITAHARERVILLSIPHERVVAMLRDPSAVARRFSAALTGDVARALHAAERPIARTSVETR